MSSGILNLPLVVRAMLGAAVLIVSGAAASVYFIVDNATRVYLADRGAASANRAERNAQRISENIDALRRDSVFLSRVPPVQGILGATLNQGVDPKEGRPLEFWKTHLQEIFSTLAEARPDYYQLRYIGIADNGRELVRVDVVDGRAVVTPPEKLQAEGDRDFFQAALKLQKGEIYLSDINLNREQGEVQVPHVRTLRAAVPVFAPDGDLFGMVVVNMDVGNLINSATTNLPPGIQGYLTNSAGDYLAHPDPSRDFGFDLGQRYTWQQDMPGLLVPPASGGAAQRPLQPVSTRMGLMHMAVERIQFDPRDPERFLLLAYALPDAFVQTRLASLRNTVLGVTVILVLVLGAVVFLLLRQAFKQTNAALQQSEARLQTVLENLTEGIAVADLDGRFLLFNRAAMKMHGFTGPEDYFRRLPEFADTFEVSALDGTVWPVDQWPLARILRGETLRDIELRIRRIGTDWQRTFSNGGALVRDSDGQPLMAVVTMRDITERKQAEEALRENEEKWRMLWESSADTVIMLDEQNVIQYVNSSVKKMFGYSPEEVIGQDLAILQPESLRQKHRDSMKRYIQTSERTMDWRGREASGLHRDGHVFPIEIAYSEINVSGGKLFGGFVRDITERKQAEERIQSQRERAEALLEATPDAVVIVDGEGRIAVVNARTETVFGYARAELLGQPVELLIPQRLHSAHIAQRAPYLEQPQARAMGAGRELFARRKDGSEFAVDISLSPLATSEGTLVISTVRDVTERKQAERRIQGQLEHLNLLDHITRAISERQDLKSIFQVVVRSLENSLPIDFGCVCLYDAAANTLRVACVGLKSEALVHELTIDEKAVIGIDDNGLGRCVRGELVYEPDIGAARFPFPARLAGGGLGSVVMAPLRAESRVFGVLIAARCKAQGFSSVECEFLRQLSAHVALAAHQAQLYGALQQAYDDLRQTQQVVMQEERLRALGQMASGIAHDINNALSPVSLYTESLLETETNLSDRARGYLQTIQRAVEDVAQTVARMREFYRQREQQLELTPVDINQMVQQVLDLTKASWSDQPMQSGIVIRALTEVAPGLPRIMGVESEIREALTNLVFNAVDAMPEGGTLTLRTRLAGAEPARSVIAEVADTGVGMDEETRRRCLEPFYTTKGERGTGLGLAMVFGMVQRHSVGLEIESAPGAGTTLRLVFAVPTAALVEPGRPAVALKAPARLRLLLIDDDPILLKSLRDALETDGHVIVAANGGEAGIAAFRAALERGERFAAVFTDLGMPYVDGRRVAAAVKAASPATPVILLTGWGQRLVAEGDIPPHVDRVLAKPPKLREVREALAHLCQAQTSGATT